MEDFEKHFLCQQGHPGEGIPFEQKDSRTEFPSHIQILERKPFHDRAPWGALPSQTEERKRNTSNTSNLKNLKNRKLFKHVKNIRNLRKLKLQKPYDRKKEVKSHMGVPAPRDCFFCKRGVSTPPPAVFFNPGGGVLPRPSLGTSQPPDPELSL